MNTFKSCAARMRLTVKLVDGMFELGDTQKTNASRTHAQPDTQSHC